MRSADFGCSMARWARRFCLGLALAGVVAPGARLGAAEANVPLKPAAWRSVGPGPGAIEANIASHAPSHTIYLASYGGGLLKSTNGGSRLPPSTAGSSRTSQPSRCGRTTRTSCTSARGTASGRRPTAAPTGRPPTGFRHSAFHGHRPDQSERRLRGLQRRRAEDDRRRRHLGPRHGGHGQSVGLLSRSIRPTRTSSMPARPARRVPVGRRRRRGGLRSASTRRSGRSSSTRPTATSSTPARTAPASIRAPTAACPSHAPARPESASSSRSRRAATGSTPARPPRACRSARTTGRPGETRAWRRVSPWSQHRQCGLVYLGTNFEGAFELPARASRRRGARRPGENGRGQRHGAGWPGSS